MRTLVINFQTKLSNILNDESFLPADYSKYTQCRPSTLSDLGTLPDFLFCAFIIIL